MLILLHIHSCAKWHPTSHHFLDQGQSGAIRVAEIHINLIHLLVFYRHMMSCGGSYTKIAEPPGFKHKRRVSKGEILLKPLFSLIVYVLGMLLIHIVTSKFVQWKEEWKRKAVYAFTRDDCMQKIWFFKYMHVNDGSAHKDIVDSNNTCHLES